MKLHVLSDLHLEFTHWQPPATDADVVVLAGDIAVGVDGLRWAATHFEDKPIIYVAGNHEYYGGRFDAVLGELRQVSAELGIHFLENSEVVLADRTGDKVRFLGCTLWTDFLLFGPAMRTLCLNAARRALNDFRCIEHDGRSLLPEQTMQWHEQHIQWLSTRLKAPFEGKTVVVTHHLPSARSVAPRYQFDRLSACFASELDQLFGSMVTWIHGHTHDSFDYEHGGTRVVCNPRGYTSGRSLPENVHFNPALVLEV